ncbi:CGNR zinc finger domain-containing protein [Salinibacterium sp. SYSU T00001]|uniref:CGNR zinc finger domain-containing protein n=1 Tax=Homoserinimonas sedimenticola TaxID=2986805 RepID=UPI0022365EBB|nr:CGNR zinc finger domain-containing protein [Salinibacterium sedimenticola]MCW4386006.1 CGNR zinc finger domain-containing protein [Salinibacterium sedimenticola]
MATGQWVANPDGTRWHFDSGALSLDFALVGVDVREQFATPADLLEWVAERFEHLDKTVTERDLRDAVLLRVAIARVAAAISAGDAAGRDDIDTINLFAATPDVPPALAGGRRRAGATRIKVSQALSSIARDAVRQFSLHGSERIRSCEAEDCSHVFVDESRANNRRWCSMQRCGNRAKVRAHRRRSAAASAH